jgi:TusA-related sulfurtransferase
MITEKRQIIVITTLDNRGSDCASGFVKLLETIAALEPGQILRVLSTDRASQRELREWAARSGNTLLQSDTTGPFWRREYHYLIRKEGGTA